MAWHGTAHVDNFVRASLPGRALYSVSITDFIVRALGKLTLAVIYSGSGRLLVSYALKRSLNRTSLLIHITRMIVSNPCNIKSSGIYLSIVARVGAVNQVINVMFV